MYIDEMTGRVQHVAAGHVRDVLRAGLLRLERLVDEAARLRGEARAEAVAAAAVAGGKKGEIVRIAVVKKEK